MYLCILCNCVPLHVLDKFGVNYCLFVWLVWVVPYLWNKKLFASLPFFCWSPSFSCVSGTIIVWPCRVSSVSLFLIGSILTYHRFFWFIVSLKDNWISEISAFFSCGYANLLNLLVQVILPPYQLLYLVSQPLLFVLFWLEFMLLVLYLLLL